MGAQVARFDPKPITLEGQHVRLEPLTPQHAEDLYAAGQDPAIWPYLARGEFTSLDDVREWIRQALAVQESGTQIPFATVLRESERAIGSTRYLDIRRADRGLEIEWTWIAPQHQRSAVNTECKYLLLRHAFEDLEAVRVQLKTDRRNERSQRAIERLGAVREGVLRKHMAVRDGFIRDTVYYSILDSEWPEVRRHLEDFLRRPA
jgi:RimJ/RimL family protein N-acetyltransferase